MEKSNERRGLNISRKKTAYLGCNEHQDTYIHLQGETVKRGKTFTYMRSTFCIGWSIGYGSHNSVQSGWKNMARVSEVLCDSTMNVTIKKKVYGIEVSPA